MARRLPIFVSAQAECIVCGKPIEDPFAVDAYERCCSARCYHARELPLGRRAA